MIDIERILSFNWKTKLTIVLGLFVFTAFNYDVRADIVDAEHIELCLSQDYFEADLLFNPVKLVQPDISPQCSFVHFIENNNIKRVDDDSNLTIANQLTSYNSFKSNISSNWHFAKSLSLPSSEDESSI